MPAHTPAAFGAGVHSARRPWERTVLRAGSSPSVAGGMTLSQGTTMSLFGTDGDGDGDGFVDDSTQAAGSLWDDSPAGPLPPPPHASGGSSGNQQLLQTSDRVSPDAGLQPVGTDLRSMVHYLNSLPVWADRYPTATRGYGLEAQAPAGDGGGGGARASASSVVPAGVAVADAQTAGQRPSAHTGVPPTANGVDGPWQLQAQQQPQPSVLDSDSDEDLLQSMCGACAVHAADDGGGGLWGSGACVVAQGASVGSLCKRLPLRPRRGLRPYPTTPARPPFPFPSSSTPSNPRLTAH
jgi:hypothetical protein